MPPARPGGGDDVDGGARADHPPHDAHAGAGVEPARQHGRQLGDQLAEGEGEVLGQVGPRGVPALARQQHVERVGSTGERALAQADRAHVQTRVGVQPEDAGDAVDRAGLDRHQRTAGHDLLGGLEDEADPSRELVGDRREREPRPEQRRGVHVVTARVGHPRDGAGPRVVGPVLDREGVQVGTQGDHRSRTGPDVDDQPVARKCPRDQAGLVETLGDDRRGPLLRPGELRVGVQVATELDQLVSEQVDLCLSGTDEGSGHNRQDYRSSAVREDDRPDWLRRRCPRGTGPR